MTRPGPPPLIDAMMRPEFYPHPVESIRFVQTHISWVFLTGPFAYKIKKPVDLGFLDYGTLEKRRFLCEKEVRLNSRLAPEVYLGVVEIRRGTSGLALGGEGETVETAVKMRELPADRMMDRLLAENRVTREMIWDVAAVLAKFHASAERNSEITSYGSLANIGRHVMDNFKRTAAHVGLTIEAGDHAALKSYTEDFLTRQADRFVDRMAKSKICDCHGDLRLCSVCYTDRPILFDCIEFNDAYRYQDVAAEIAFLSMDLEAHGAGKLSNAFINAYLEWSSDFALLPLLNFYKTYRACVRAKVASFMLDDPGIDPEQKRAAVDEGKRYFALAKRYTRSAGPRGVVILSAPVGSGKSTVARVLAESLDGIIIRSDAVRKHLAGLPPTARAADAIEKGLYSPDFSEKTYAALFRFGEEVIAAGRWLVLDAAFLRRAERARAEEWAAAHALPFWIVHPTCPPETVRRRLLARQGDPREISDADKTVYERMRLSWEPFADSEKGRVISVDNGRDESPDLQEAVRILRRD